MHSRRLLPIVLIAFVLSILIAVVAAARRSEVTFALAAILFGVQVLLALLRINVPLWRPGANAESGDWAWDNSALAAITYVWGAGIMFTAYSLGGLVWRHWWQYGAGMLLLGAGVLACAGYVIGARAPHATGGALRTLMRITVAHAAAVVAALVYLVASGKLATPKDDWAANVVFITGGVTILLISLVSLTTWRRLGGSRQRSAT